METLTTLVTLFAVALAALALCILALRAVDRLVFPDLSFARALADNNVAVGIFLAALVFGIFFLVSNATGSELDRYDRQFRKWARYEFGFSYPWQVFKAQGMAESGLDPTLCSRAGACGLMQFMPGTALAMGLQDRFEARESIRLGIRYDRRLWRSFTAPRPHWDRLAFALMAYNAGLGNVLRFQAAALSGGADPNRFRTIRPFVWREPRTYIERILRWCKRFGGWKCSTG